MGRLNFKNKIKIEIELKILFQTRHLYNQNLQLLKCEIAKRTTAIFFTSF